MSSDHGATAGLRESFYSPAISGTIPGAGGLAREVCLEHTGFLVGTHPTFQQFLPQGHCTMINAASPYLRVRNAGAAIEFYQQAFGATEEFRLTEPSGRIGHSELKFGPVTIMVSDEYPEYGIQGPETIGGTGSSVFLQVDNVDAITLQSVDAGAELIMKPADQFYGERTAKIKDPFGHEWLISTRIEEVTPEQMQQRFDALFRDGNA